MADIFISYSKPDRFSVERLAAFLEAEGWSVWWDRSLSAGDAYRDQIMTELVKARAVVVVWTENSIGSEWVRAEAGRAKSEGKLIPVKAAGVDYKDIPLPFGEMHTEALDSAALIRAALVAQLARPAATGFRAATAEARYMVLTWVGIVGGAITLFANLKGLIEFADWMRKFTDQWVAWTHFVWKALLGWIGIEIPIEWSPILTFVFFILATVVGIKLSAGQSSSVAAAHVAPSVPPGRRRPMIATYVFLLALCFLHFQLRPQITNWLEELVFSDTARHIRETSGLILLLCFAVSPLFFVRDKAAVGFFIVLYVIAVTSFLAVPALQSLGNVTRAGLAQVAKDDYEARLAFLQPFEARHSAVKAAVIIGGLAWPLILLVVPASKVNRRFIFMFIGIGILFALNWVSTLGLRQYFS